MKRRGKEGRKEGRKEGGKGAAAAKGDYKEKYSPHSLPTHALQGASEEDAGSVLDRLSCWKPSITGTSKELLLQCC